MPPKYLLSKRGGLLRPSRSVADLFACPRCGAELERAETGWVCPRSLGHGGLVPDGLLAERLADRFRQLGHRRRNPRRTLYVRKRVQFWRRKIPNPIP